MSEGTYENPDYSLLGEDHVRAYRETNGETGYDWNGAPSLLLTTTGRKTGQPRTSPLIFARDGDEYLVVASMGGAPMHPQWYLNLEANPRAQIQVKAEHLEVVARTASDDEKPRLWETVNAAWPNYDVYQTRTARLIPVVVLTPTSP
ncbi:MAG: nitroreductase family deazaflavin-dependent oxidoreductase [Acidimicrobiia bacterium]|nr:nitroreductase family deazaflavin-dependent oxidoreductase [Acidimicrobiia bacterium]